MAVVTTAQAAVLIGTTEANVRQMAKRGKLTRVGIRNRQATFALDQVKALAAERNGRVSSEQSE